MKNAIPFLALVFLLVSGCNTKSTEKVFQDYMSEKLNDLKQHLPKELKMLDSLLLDSGSIKQKIAEISNLDSLEKYSDLLMKAKTILEKDSLNIDSISPEMKQLLELNK